MGDVTSITAGSVVSDWVHFTASAGKDLVVRTAYLALGIIGFIAETLYSGCFYLSGGYICRKGVNFSLVASYFEYAGCVGSVGSLALTSLIGYAIIRKHQTILNKQIKQNTLLVAMASQELEEHKEINRKNRELFEKFKAEIENESK